MALSSPGVGSNLDVNGIVSQLMSIEQRPLKLIDLKEASYQAQLSAFGSLKGSLSSLQNAAIGLTSGIRFQSYKATSSDTTSLSASTTSTATAGTYSIGINKLAQAQKLTAAGQANLTGTFGTGTLSFDFGTISGNTFDPATGKYGTTLSADTSLGSNTVIVPSTANLAVGAAISGAGIPVGATIASITDGTHFEISAPATATGAAVALQASPTFTSNGAAPRTVTIDSTNNTLAGIRDAINAAKLGVTASIVNDGSATPYRLVLSSDATGAANSMKVSVAGDTALSNLLANNPADPSGQKLSETISAQNAEIVVNGVAATKSSNVVTDVIHGVTLSLLKTTTSPLSLTVARDSSSITSALDSFVKAYNDANKMLRDVSAYDANTKKAAILQGDAAVRTIQNQMRSLLNAPQSGVSGIYTTLSQIGVSFQKDGSLVVDSAKLQNAISSDVAGVSSVVVATGKSAKSLLDNILGESGAIASRSDGINKTIKSLDNQRETITRRLLGIEQRYRTQFSTLDTLIGQMSQTSNFLSQQLANLPKIGG